MTTPTIDLARLPDAIAQRFARGEPVWYVQRRAGGYGFDRHLVPARFVAYGACLVNIAVLPAGQDATDVRLLHVDPRNVRARVDSAWPIDDADW